MDYAAKLLLSKNQRGALFFFDFEAAFPSVAHEHLWEVLKHIGCPGSYIHAVQQLYSNNTHTVLMDGSWFPSATVFSGVRQGCPLSPTLFVLAIDILLTLLDEDLPGDTTILAFADDIGLASTNWVRDLPDLIRHFADFQDISALKLNVGKTIFKPVVPLDPLETALLSNSAWDNLPTSFGPERYLGIHIDFLHSVLASFTPVDQKFRTRIKQWKNLQLPLYHKLLTYNIMHFSLFSYLFQHLLLSPAQYTGAT